MPTDPSPTARPRRRSRVGHFRRSVVVTVASGAAASFTGGCGEQVTISNPPFWGHASEDGIVPGFDAVPDGGPRPDATPPDGGPWDATPWDARHDAEAGIDGAPPDGCPPPSELLGPCDQEGLECPTGGLTGCGVDEYTECYDGQWLWSYESCNPPYIEDGCPDPATLSDLDPCAQEDLECPTGGLTGCGEPQTAACWSGQWHFLEVSCNPPPPDVDGGPPKDDAGPFGDGVQVCPLGTTVPEAGSACDEDTDCHMGLCVLDWSLHIQCQQGTWRLRPFLCFQGDWGEWDEGEPDGGG